MLCVIQFLNMLAKTLHGSYDKLHDYINFVRMDEHLHFKVWSPNFLNFFGLVAGTLTKR